MTDDRDQLQPMSGGDVAPPPAGTDFTPAAPLKDAGVAFESAEGGTLAGGKLDEAKQAVRDGGQKLAQQAGDRARTLADEGKSRAIGALGELTQLLNDAAGQVDEKLGAQYGQYARTAADKVQGFSSAIDQKSVDDLLDDVRGFVRKSPSVAIGAAAAVGFVVARLLTAGYDSRDQA